MVRIFPIQEIQTKSGEPMKKQSVMIQWDEERERPSQIVLEQAWEKLVSVVSSLKEGKYYIFYLSFRAREWMNPKTNILTAFGSISAWKVEWDTGSNDDLPF